MKHFKLSSRHFVLSVECLIEFALEILSRAFISIEFIDKISCTHFIEFELFQN